MNERLGCSARYAMESASKRRSPSTSAQRGKVFGESAEHAIPILPVVDLKALEGGEAASWAR